MKVKDILDEEFMSLQWLQNYVIIIDPITNEQILSNQHNNYLLMPVKLIDDNHILCADFLIEIKPGGMYHKVYESCKILLANCDVVNWLDIEHNI